jgi:hypothetical protein
MKYFKTAGAVFSIALLGAMFSPALQADVWNKKTVVTFSGPVEIPQVHLAGWGVLPAGTYVFKIMDSLSNRHIVQISSEDEKTVYATILAIPNYRLKATDKTVITFRERPAGQPEALRAWFYPGRLWGEEFVYPKAQAMELAKATNTPVLYTPAELPYEVAEANQVTAAPVMQEMRRAPVMAVTPTGEDVELDQVVTAPPPERQDVTTPRPERQQVAQAREPMLPDTASTLPLIALFGLLALGGALAVRAASNRLR